MNTTHRLFQRGLVAGMCLAYACTTTAATVYFEATDGYASEQANWSSGALPTASDTLAMTNLGTNVMRIQDGDNIKVAVLKVCRNNNDGKKKQADCPPDRRYVGGERQRRGCEVCRICQRQV